MSLKSNISLIIIVICLPIILWEVCAIGPTFDDYTSLQSTWFIQISDPGYMFPDAYRRPFDFLLGCLLGWFPALFPVLNHVLIILGHTISALLVFSICKKLSFSSVATHIATLFFFFSPATLGATLACDGFNQTYAQLWGLLALWFYLVRVTPCSSAPNTHVTPCSSAANTHVTPCSSAANTKSWLWILCVAMAALSKENGLAWAVVPPIVAYAFQFVSRRQALRHIGYGLLVALAFFVIYGIIYVSGIAGIEYDEQYTEVTLLSHVKDFIQLMAYTWLPADYMSIVYEPTRNLPLAIVTVVLSLPFLGLLTAGTYHILVRPAFRRYLLLLFACFLILVLPHLITVVSMMHNYAGLSVAAVIVGLVVNHLTSKRAVVVCFTLFLATALFTDIHHYRAARQSALFGKRMAMLAISKADHPLQRVLCINIDNPDEPRYSNFCVRPVDAFGWGLSVRHYSHYAWKTAISEITLPQYDKEQVNALADSALQAGDEAVWIAGYDKEPLLIITE